MMSHDPDANDGQSILVVDDTRANVRLLREMLTQEGYSVRVALNGEMALRAIRESPPDLVLLDVMMPRMDGFTVCRTLKEDERSAEIPVIFISSLHNAEDKVKAFDAGGVDYVTKPFHSMEVLARVKTHLDLRRHTLALRYLNERLVRSNQELEEFAYVASHDMREPLRVMMGFCDLLEKKSAQKLEAGVQRYVEHIRDGAEHMEKLIDSLLEYSRISTQPRPFEPVDLEAVARRVLADLEVRVRELQATVEIRNLPQVRADEMQMWQLLRNLVSNALKFHRPGCAPFVTIEGVPADDQVQVSVTDNGIGFDEKHKDQIFQIFRRLHSPSQYKGTGIGLAVCKKIVERHGGTIDVSSTPGAATTFRFTLPVA